VTAQLRGPHDLGAIVGYAWRIYRAYFATFFGLALIVAPMQMLEAVIQRRIDDEATSSSVSMVFLVPDVLVSLVAIAALIHAADTVAGGTRPQAGGSIDAAFARYGDVVTTAMLSFGLALASLFAAPALALWWLLRRDAAIDGRRDWWLAVIPLALTLYLAVRWALSQQAVVLGNRRGWPALDASAGAVRGQWWRVAGILLTLGLIEAGPILLSSASSLAHPLVEATVVAAVSSFVLPFFVIAQTLLWYDLIARKASHASTAGITAA
jgi:hypothetical protein